jgi:hypothetical protein
MARWVGTLRSPLPNILLTGAHLAQASAVTCLTPDDQIAVLDVATGANVVNYTVPLLPFQKDQPYHRFCLTADCYTIRRVRQIL